MNIESLRREYKRSELNDDSVHPDPILQFGIWFEEAVHAGLDEVNAMTLATASAKGRPAARIVLLKAYDHKGFTFFTSYQGRKAKELDENPQAALLFFWKELERQVRLEGRVEKVLASESDRYFDSRSLESRISAAASPQSQEVPSRRYLEELWVRTLKESGGETIQRPDTWGGYRLIPERMEFWQGRPKRLHDRLLYALQGEKWRITRLAP